MAELNDSLTGVINLGKDEHASVVNSKRMAKRKFYDKLFYRLCQSTILLALCTLIILVSHILISGLSWLSLDFFTNFTSRFAEQAGIKAHNGEPLGFIFDGVFCHSSRGKCGHIFGRVCSEKKMGRMDTN